MWGSDRSGHQILSSAQMQSGLTKTVLWLKETCLGDLRVRLT